MTTVFIDAAACPVTRDAMAVARPHLLPVVRERARHGRML